MSNKQFQVIGVAVLAVLSAIGVVHAGDKPDVEPGLWNIDRRMVLRALPLPPKPKYLTQCLKKEDIPNHLELLSPKGQNDLTDSCEVSDVKVGEHELTAKLVCEGGQKNGSLHMHYEGKKVTSELAINESLAADAQPWISYNDTALWAGPCPAEPAAGK
ncbi:MAG: DUF3617 family protein [Burkholderiales bacterium]|nr:DUF3617 family protein [Burkholderiales bacterium]